MKPLRILWFATAIFLIFGEAGIGWAQQPEPREPPLPALNWGVSQADKAAWTQRFFVDAAVGSTAIYQEEPRARDRLEHEACKLDERTFCVKNFGPEPVILSFLTAEKKWETIMVPAFGRVEGYCENCGGETKLAFHNGSIQTIYNLKLGFPLRADWSNGDRAWQIKAEGADVLAPSKNANN